MKANKEVYNMPKIKIVNKLDIMQQILDKTEDDKYLSFFTDWRYPRKNEIIGEITWMSYKEISKESYNILCSYMIDTLFNEKITKNNVFKRLLKIQKEDLPIAFLIWKRKFPKKRLNYLKRKQAIARKKAIDTMISNFLLNES
jgi:hypothetical protein